MNVSPEGSGNITAPQFTTNPVEYPASYTCSAEYTLTAVRSEGYEFVDWIVNVNTETDNPLTISTADGAKSVTAYFKQTNTPDNPPVAEAGPDQPANEGDQVILDGSASYDPDNDIRRYFWEQVSGTSVTLTNAQSVKASFLAPNVIGDPETLTFRLTVEDIPGESSIDTVNIVVNDTGVDPPTADAGPDQDVTQRETVTLDGTGSFDPNDNIRSYFWEQTQGIDVTLSDLSAAKPKFTAPEVIDDPISLIFKLVVEDFSGLTDEDSVTITVHRGQIGGTSTSAGCFISGCRR